MKSLYKKIIPFVLILFFWGFSLNNTFSQDAPPPPPPDHGSTGNQGPSDAPIAGGIAILLALGGGYGGYKLYVKKRRKLLD